MEAVGPSDDQADVVVESLGTAVVHLSAIMKIPPVGGVGDRVIPLGQDVRVAAGSGPRRTEGCVLVAEQRGGADRAEEDLEMIDIVEILIHYCGSSTDRQSRAAASRSPDGPRGVPQRTHRLPRNRSD